MYANGKANKMSVTISNKDPMAYNNGFKLKAPTSSSTCVWPSDGGDFEFSSPPEAPVFKPTQEEFLKGPLEYIAKIRQFAEPYGICKIIPPSNFQPPFAVDVEKFRFTPRVQRLNELEAQTRVKLNFLEQIIKYWDLQGTYVRDKARGASLKIPTIEKKVLDLHVLHKVVQEEGGFEVCTTERKWSRVALKMGFYLTSQNKGTVASLLRQHYERILYPYDVFLSGATIGPDIEKSESERDDTCDDHKRTPSRLEKSELDGDCGSSEDCNGLKAPKQPRRLMRRMTCQQRTSPTESAFQSKELKKLQVYGAGPKMPGFSAEEEGLEVNKTSVCIQCGDGQASQQLLRCAGCNNLYHLFCLIPPLSDTPKGVWHCPRCVAYLVQSQPQPFTHEFGFMQSQRDYSLSEFGEMADQFKRDYFRMSPHSVPLSVVEKEFWRLVASMEDTVTVEYGADLHTNDFGSGFPTKLTQNIISADAEYIDHSWNLNNLPVIDGSVFKYINANISGMIVPWMYVGMCFSTFCWHNEDHWSYSINYLHWGEAKSWYGVPGNEADTFESAMKQAAPELFDSQPDLLHQLVTICNPNLLMKMGVPIFRTNQQAGEFVVTFPRAYHAGFNQGLNFAEAVNFAPAEWVVLGRQCMLHYSMLHRYPVFSHDELICKMACDPDSLDISIAVATYNDMLEMVTSEKEFRLKVLDWGVTSTKRLTFELFPDDERQCEVCRTTCFLSALTCACSQEKLVCMLHKASLCKKCLPSDHTLRFRFNLDELRILMEGIKRRIDAHGKWLESVKQAFDKKNSTKLTLSAFKALSEDAIKKRFPTNTKIYNQLKSAIEEAEKASKAAKELLEQQNKVDEVNNLKKVKQEFQETVSSARLKKKLEKNGVPTAAKLKSLQRSVAKAEKEEVINDKLTLEELSLFHEEIESYACTIPESVAIKQLFDRCVDVSEKIMKTLRTFTSENISQVPPSYTSDYLENVVEVANSIAVVSFGKQLEKFKQRLNEVQWFEDCNLVLSTTKDDESKEAIDIEMIKALIDAGLSLVPTNEVIRQMLTDLQRTIEEILQWREKKMAESIEKARKVAHEENKDHALEKASAAAAAAVAKRKKEECLNRKKKDEGADRKKPKLCMKEKLEKRKPRRNRNEKEGSKSGKYDLCSMNEKCLKPSDAEVDWVFCEGPCQGWFHQLCAGIQSPDEIAHLEKYYCIICREYEDNENDVNVEEAQVAESENV